MDTINQATAGSKGVEYWVDMAQALERLYENEDFKKVILRGYFEDKAISGTSILASDQVKSSGRRTDVMEGLIAISSLQDHFNVIMMMGTSAKEDAEEAGYIDEESSSEYNIEE